MATAPAAHAPAENPFDNAIEQLNAVADRLHLDEGMREVLRHCKREFTVNFPVQMDDGSIRVFTGYRVHHNEARGPVKGGLRYGPNVTLDEVRAVDVDDVEVRRRRAAVRRREGWRHRRSPRAQQARAGAHDAPLRGRDRHPSSVPNRMCPRPIWARTARSWRGSWTRTA